MKQLNIKDIQKIILETFLDLNEVFNKHNIKYYFIGGSCLGAIRHKGFIPWDDDIDLGLLRQDYDKFLEVCNEMPEKYYVSNYKFDKYADHLLTRIYIKGTFVDELYPKHFKGRKELYLDIFPLDVIPDEIKEKQKQKNQIKCSKLLLYYKTGIHFGCSKIKNLLRDVVHYALLPISNKFIIKKTTNQMTKYNDRFHKESTICSLASQYSYEKQSMSYSIYGEGKMVEFENIMVRIPSQPEKYLTQLYGDYMKLPPIEKQVYKGKSFIGK